MASGRVVLGDSMIGAPATDEATAGWIEDPASQTRKVLGPLLGSGGGGFDVILLAGQSNMEGQGSPADLGYLDNPDSRILQYAGSTDYLGQVVQAIDPLLHHRVAAGRIGPGMSFAKWWVRSYGRQVLLVPTAHSATGFRTTDLSPAPANYHTVANGGSWDPDATDGGFNLFDYAVEQTNAAIASHPQNRIVAILWQQGEGDSAAVGGVLTASQYRERLDALIDGFRAQITGAVDVPFLVGRSSYDAWYDDHPADIPILDESHMDTAVRRERTAWVQAHAPGELEADGIHINAVGQRKAGGIYYPEAYLLAVENVGGTPPVAPAVIRATQDGTEVLVEWDRPLCRATNYQVQTNRAGAGWVTEARVASTENKQLVTGLVLGSELQVRVATINETGTSANSPVTDFDVLDVPAVPAGLAVDSTAWSATVTWGAAARAATYTVERKLTSGGAWTPVTTSQLTARMGGLLASTSYDYRVKASNAAGSSAYSAIVAEATLAPTFLQDDAAAVPVAAWSVRKIRSTYAGPCLRVRNSATAVQTDIGFDANGTLDLVALAAAIGANTGFVVKWYNQGSSGAVNDIEQATAGFQPRVRLTGVNQTHNGVPAVFFDGLDDFLYSTNPFVLASPTGVTVLAVAQTLKFNTVLFGEVGTSNRPGWTTFFTASNGKGIPVVANDQGVVVAQPPTAATLTDDDTLRQTTGIDTTTALTFRRDGVEHISAFAYFRSGTYTPTLINVGTSVAPFYHQGHISELAIWTNAADIDLDRAEANQRGFFATP